MQAMTSCLTCRKQVTIERMGTELPEENMQDQVSDSSVEESKDGGEDEEEDDDAGFHDAMDAPDLKGTSKSELIKMILELRNPKKQSQPGQPNVPDATHSAPKHQPNFNVEGDGEGQGVNVNQADYSGMNGSE